MANGIVKWFNSKKGYGFITYTDDNDEDKDIFVHYTAVEATNNGFKTLYEGDKVEFSIMQGDKGPQAGNVSVLEKAPRPRRDRKPSYKF